MALSRPDVLQVTITLGKAVEGVIALTAGTDEAAHRVGLVLAGVATVLVDLADGDLNRGVVVGLDDTVGCAALARDVAVGLNMLAIHSFYFLFFIFLFLFLLSVVLEGERNAIDVVDHLAAEYDR